LRLFPAEFWDQAGLSVHTTNSRAYGSVVNRTLRATAVITVT
jgi:hypothetical protein